MERLVGPVAYRGRQQMIQRKTGKRYDPLLQRDKSLRIRLLAKGKAISDPVEVVPLVDLKDYDAQH